MSITDIGQAAAEETSGDGGGGSRETDYDRLDVSGKQYAKMHPGPTAIAGTATHLRYFPPNPNSSEDNPRGYAGLVIEDPYIPEDDEMENVAIYKSSSEKGDDYKIVNTDDESVDTYDVGISVGQMFESEEIDEFDTDEIILTLSTSAGRSVARTLDVKGLPNADVQRTENGQPEIKDHGYPESNNALIETCPDNDDETYIPPRYHRDTQLRPDVEGEEVVIMVQHLANVQEGYEGNSHWSTVLVNIDDDRMQELAETYAEDPYYEPEDADDFIDDVNGTDMLRLSPTAEFEPDENLARATSWFEWRYPGEDELETLREEQGVSVN